MGDVVKLERKRDEVFDAVVSVCDIDLSQMTRTARGPLNRAVRELKEVGASAAAIEARAAMYRERYEGMTLTPMALVKHWPSLNPPKESRWSVACRLAKERGDGFKGAPYETAEDFMRRMGV